MRRVVAIAVLLSALAAGTAEARSYGACPVPSTATVQAVSRHAILLLYDRVDRDGLEHTRLVGCFRRDGRRVTANATDEFFTEWIQTGGYRLAGHFVGWWERTGSQYFDEYLSVHAFDLRRRHAKHDLLIGYSSGPDVPSPELGSLLLARDGSLVWGVVDHGREHGDPRRVEVSDPGKRTLDQGAGVDIASVRLHGRTITWLHDGRARSATLR